MPEKKIWDADRRGPDEGRIVEVARLAQRSGPLHGQCITSAKADGRAVEGIEVGICTVQIWSPAVHGDPRSGVDVGTCK